MFFFILHMKSHFYILFWTGLIILLSLTEGLNIMFDMFSSCHVISSCHWKIYYNINNYTLTATIYKNIQLLMTAAVFSV